MSWIKSFESVFPQVVSSVIVKGNGSPPLTSTEYRQLAQDATRNIMASTRFNDYTIDFTSPPLEAIELIESHPAIKSLLDNNKNTEEFAIGGLNSGYLCKPDVFPLELLSRLVNSSMTLGIRASLETFDKVLTLGAKHRLPGFQATFIVGMQLRERWDIAEGLYLVSYDEFEQQLPTTARWSYTGRLQPDHNKQSPVVVLMKEFLWGPAVVADWNPTSWKFPREHDAVLLTNLFAVTSARPLLVVGQCERAQKWVYEVVGAMSDIALHYHSHYPGDKGSHNATQLSSEQLDDIKDTVSRWRKVNSKETTKIDVAISRLARSLSRRGMLAQQDRVLDIAIALEILYKLDRSELAEKLSTRAGWYLGESGKNRAEIKRETTKFYSARSKLVHGTNVEPDRIMCDRAFSIARQTLMKHLAIGKIPSDQAWNNIVMGTRACAVRADG